MQIRGKAVDVIAGFGGIAIAAAALLVAIPVGLDTASGMAHGTDVEVACNSSPRPLAIQLEDGRRICFGRGMSRAVDFEAAAFESGAQSGTIYVQTESACTVIPFTAGAAMRIDARVIAIETG